MIELDITLPSIRHIHKLMRDPQDPEAADREVEVKLVTGDDIRGFVKWIDNHCICVETRAGTHHTLLVWHQAIAYIKS
jgi:host factor-I protein